MIEMKNEEDEDYDPGYEEDKILLETRRSSHEESVVLTQAQVVNFLAGDKKDREELIKSILNDEHEVITPFADHFMPVDDARYSLDECPPPEITYVEIDHRGRGAASLQGTCSKHSPCKGMEDLGREIEGEIIIRVDTKSARLHLRVERIAARSTRDEF